MTGRKPVAAGNGLVTAVNRLVSKVSGMRRVNFGGGRRLCSSHEIEPLYFARCMI